jgi:hypothetical protein
VTVELHQPLIAGGMDLHQAVRSDYLFSLREVDLDSTVRSPLDQNHFCLYGERVHHKKDRARPTISVNLRRAIYLSLILPDKRNHLLTARYCWIL